VVALEAIPVVVDQTHHPKIMAVAGAVLIFRVLLVEMVVMAL